MSLSHVSLHGLLMCWSLPGRWSTTEPQCIQSSCVFWSQRSMLVGCLFRGSACSQCIIWTLNTTVSAEEPTVSHTHVHAWNSHFFLNISLNIPICWFQPFTQRLDHPKSKHNNLRSYSHFLAQISDALVFRGAPLLRETEFFLEFGILLFQCLELEDDPRMGGKMKGRKETDKRERFRHAVNSKQKKLYLLHASNSLSHGHQHEATVLRYAAPLEQR